jgi:hypothetical protein
MLFSLTGGDDADDFFAMAILSIGVHHQQHNDGTELDGAECMPALLSVFVYTVQLQKTMLVFEGERCLFE